MTRNILTVILVTLFVATLAMAQDGSVKVHYRQLVDDNATGSVVEKHIAPPAIINGENVITTNYDYFTNSVNRDQIVYDVTNQKPHLFNMVRPWQGAATRHAAHSRKEGTSWVTQSVSNGAGGWPHIDLGLTGDGTGTLALVWHTPSRLSIWDGGAGYLTAQFDPSTDPSVQMSGGNIYLATSGGRVQYQFYKTTDFGVSFANWDSIKTFVPSWTNNGGVEVGMSKSQNEQHLVMFGNAEGTPTGGGAHVYSGANPNEADCFWVMKSTNGGTNWTAQKIAVDGEFDKVVGYHTPNFAPIIENFSQTDIAIANNGVFHAVANGYGLRFNATRDTSLGAQFPLLYYNSTSNTWKAISSRAIDTIGAIANYYPTNAIGQSYPSVATNEDGSVVYVIWTGPQLNAQGGLDTAANGAATPAMYYWRDLYHAYSTNGGNTWVYGGKFPGMSNTVSETYAVAAQHLERVSATKYRAHIVYLADLTTGVGPFDNVLTDNPIVYTTFDIDVVSADNTPIANSFELGQNYPNPFNPSTRISYSVAERTNVSIKVFDMLGKEVATLVNEIKDAGSYDVSFNASNLASGMYVYTITAGNFTASKKMMLMK
jgi:hypothetical protein